MQKVKTESKSKAPEAPKKEPKIIKNNLKPNKRKDGLVLFTALLISVCAVMAISAVLLFATITNDEKYKFFGVDENKKFSQIISFDKPNHKPAVVSNWVSNAIVTTFDFNYINMQDHINKEADKWFTPAGKAKLDQAIQSNSSYFSDVISKEAVVQLTLRQSPIFIQGRVNRTTRKYEWVFQVPVMFTYITSESEPQVSSALFSLTVERVSYAKDARGLGISKLIISQ